MKSETLQTKDMSTINDIEGKAIPEDVIPAIAMALCLYSKQIREEERTMLTSPKTVITCSAWSSKIFGLRKHPKNW